VYFHASSGSIALGEFVEVYVILYLTEWNTAFVDRAFWESSFRASNGRTVTDSVKACPDFGWVIENPDVVNGDTIEHRIILHNDDENETFTFTDIAFGLSDDYTEFISSVDDYTDSLEDEILGPGQCMYYRMIEEPCTVGDADGSSEIDIDDVVYLINFIFAGGTPPNPYGSGDADCSDAVDIDDVVYLIDYIFLGGPAPGQTCTCWGDRQRDGGAAHIYGTFKIMNGRQEIVVENWLDHPTDSD
jgi:hypothetical protein